MFLVVGLGNPGSGYAKNRHNIGFMAVDDIVDRHNFSPFRSKFQGQITDGTIAGEKVIVLKPETYMNLSGDSVIKAASFYKIHPDNIIVIHDDLDLPVGKVKVKKGGGAGGHNGLKSIDSHIGKEYHRIRVGIGRPTNKMDVSNFVLSNFAKADEEWLEKLLSAISQCLPHFIRRGSAFFTTRLANALNPKPKKEKKQAEKTNADAPQNSMAKKTDETALGLALKEAFSDK